MLLFSLFECRHMASNGHLLKRSPQLLFQMKEFGEPKGSVN